MHESELQLLSPLIFASAANHAGSLSAREPCPFGLDTAGKLINNQLIARQLALRARSWIARI